MVAELRWWVGRDNPAVLTLYIDGRRASAAELSAITRWLLILSGGASSVVVDSQSAPVGTFVLDAPNARLEIDLSEISGLSAGRYRAQLISYDPAHDDGIVWLDQLAELVA
jgi:hypothetical protein